MQQLSGELVKTDSFRNLVEFSGRGTDTPRPAQSNLRDAVQTAQDHQDYVSVDIGAIDEGVPIGEATYDTTRQEVISLDINPQILSDFGEKL